MEPAFPRHRWRRVHHGAFPELWLPRLPKALPLLLLMVDTITIPLIPNNAALLSSGNVNQYLLLDFASAALNDMTVLGKAVTESYYGVTPRYSYGTAAPLVDTRVS
jgi:hypothetical protein